MSKTSKENLDLWLRAQTKGISLAEFREKTGMVFSHFTETYPKETRARWKQYLEERSSQEESPMNRARESHLLRIIGVWKSRYYDIKGKAQSPLPPSASKEV